MFLIVLVLLGSTLIGSLRGFVREAVSLVFWIAGRSGRPGSSARWSSPHLGGLLADPQHRAVGRPRW